MLLRLQFWQLAQPQTQLTQHRWLLLTVLLPEMLERVRSISIPKGSLLNLTSFLTFPKHIPNPLNYI
jgi:hypothetical protein